jgi:hypothetical protein
MPTPRKKLKKEVDGDHPITEATFAGTHGNQQEAPKPDVAVNGRSTAGFHPGGHQAATAFWTAFAALRITSSTACAWESIIVRSFSWVADE